MSAKLLFCCWKKSHEWLNQESAHNVAARRKSQPPAPSNRGPDCCSFPYIHGTATKYNYSDGQIWPKYSWSVQISFLNRQLQKRTQRKPDWPTRLAGNTQKQGNEKMKFSFFHQRHTLSMSFDIFVVTYRVTNLLPKLITCYYFLQKKLNFHFLNSPILGCCPPGRSNMPCAQPNAM